VDPTSLVSTVIDLAKTVLEVSQFIQESVPVAEITVSDPLFNVRLQ
jgi:hypothetical protein